MKKTIKVYPSGDSYLKKHEYLDFGKILAPQNNNAKPNILTISGGTEPNKAKVTYISNSYKEYQAEFSKNTNPYLLLMFLSKNPRKVFTINDLDGVLKDERDQADKDYKRRLPDTIRSLRVKLDLANDNPDDPFISTNGYGLKCKVELDI